MKKILVVSPHVDDETLGAGGMLLKNNDEGNENYWLNITNAKQEFGYSKEEEDKGIQEAALVAKEYCMKQFIDLRLEPAGLDKYPLADLAKRIGGAIDKIKPNIIILPFYGDVHTDHQIVFKAAYSCTKAFRFPYIQKIMCMEIISETDYALSDSGFVPNYYVDISNYVEEKIRIMKNYKSEIKNSPFPRNEQAIKGLAKFRASACNVEYAEAFRIIKEIER